MKSKNYDKFYNYYKNGFWNIEMLRNVVGKKTGITEEEFKQITDQDY